MTVLLLRITQQGLETALIFASWNGRLDTVKLLLSRGANANILNNVSLPHPCTSFLTLSEGGASPA
jgi:ankyrin repeat protein